MVKKCVAPGCKSGYDSNREEDKRRNTTIFTFPKDPGLRDRWIRAIPRKD